MTEVEKLRLFVAAEIPESHLSWLDDAMRPLRKKWSSGRWIPRENQHVTLKFLGWTPTDRLDAVARVLQMVARGHPPGDVRLTQLGAFPGPRRARVLWVGLDDPNRLMGGLAEDLGRAFESLGYGVEDRPFQPHLTLARFRAPVRLEEPLPQLETSALDAFGVDKLSLFRSRLSPGGARYELLEAIDLLPSAGSHSGGDEQAGKGEKGGASRDETGDRG